MIRNKGRSKPQIEKLSFDSNFRKRSDPNETHNNTVQTDHNDKFLFCNDCNHNCSPQKTDSVTVAVISFYYLT